MPLYEYKCDKCGVIFEKIVSTSGAAEKIICEKCSSSKVTKIISATSYRLSSSSSNSIPAGALSGCSAKGGFS